MEPLMMNGATAATGSFTPTLYRGDPFELPDDWQEGDPLPEPKIEVPQSGFAAKLSAAPWGWWLRNRLRMLLSFELLLPLYVWFLRRISPRGILFGTAELRGAIYRRDSSGQLVEVIDLGLLGRHLVVTAGKNYLVGTLDGTNSSSVLKYHAFGTGTTAAAAGDTALQTEVTVYATSNTRPTGTQAHSSNTYTTVATFSPTGSSTLAVTEWGLLSQAATGGGTLLDHQVFSAVNLNEGSDSLATTYVFTQN
jgi:hypothetical protein